MSGEIQQQYKNLLLNLQNIKTELEELDLGQIELSTTIKENFTIDNKKFMEEEFLAKEKEIISLKNNIAEELIPKIKNKI